MSNKTQKSDRTKYFLTRVWIYQILDVLLTYFPFIFFGIKAFVDATPVQRLGVSATLLMSIFLCILQFLYKRRWRSMPWILLLGFSFVLNSLHWVILLLAVCTLLDEIFVYPMLQKSKQKYTINKEIDRRG